jgi:hypothetical protein
MKDGDGNNKNNEDKNHAENLDSFKTDMSNFLPTSHRIMQFSNGKVRLKNRKEVLFVIPFWCTCSYLSELDESGNFFYFKARV